MYIYISYAIIIAISTRKSLLSFSTVLNSSLNIKQRIKLIQREHCHVTAGKNKESTLQ